MSGNGQPFKGGDCFRSKEGMKMRKRKISTALVGIGLILGMFSNGAFAATSGAIVPQPDYSGLANHDTSNSATVNSNQTGQGVDQNDGSTKQSVIKSDQGGTTDPMTKDDGTKGTQRTHGEYQNNTDSCASCHQTHTANGETLLFKDGVFNTCTACHDGTLGFYNVFSSGAIASTAGTFGGTTTGNMSAHLATGAMQVKAAPGGNKDGTDTNSWAAEFDCASCHSPHGSYSDRLLNYNPNNMGNSTQDQGGIKVTGSVYSVSGIPNSTPPKVTVNDQSITQNYIIVKDTVDKFTDSSKADNYSKAIVDKAVPAGSTVVVVYKWNGSKYVTNAGNAWIYGSVYGSPKNWYTRFYKNTDGLSAAATDQFFVDASKNYPNVVDPADSDVTFVYNQGFAYAPASGSLDSIVGGDIAQAYVVKFDEVKVADFGGVPIYYVNEAATHGGALDSKGTIGSLANTDALKLQWSDSKTHSNGSGMGVALNKFCVACHTDYFSTNAGALSGTFSSNYRHVTNSDSYTCVRCHFAHGTDVSVMKNSLGQTVVDMTKLENPATPGTNWTEADATAYMLDKNPSSALKRYTNMSVCWGCHTSSHADQFKNSNGYWGNSQAPAGLTDGDTPSVMESKGTLPYGHVTTPDQVADNGSKIQ
jgi:predicted CXXCH cytochrome family protein